MVVRCCFEFDSEFDSWLKAVFDADLQNMCKIARSAKFSFGRDICKIDLHMLSF